MPDPSLKARNDLVCGMMGSGKTTFVLRLMLNSNPACRFVFDDLGRTAPRLGIKPCYTLRELEDSFSTRWSIFDPARMFTFDEKLDRRDLAGPVRRAFKWWCAWLFDVAGRGPGVKMISMPEIWRFCTPDSIPYEFALLAQAGRELDTHLIMDTQRPDLVNDSVIGAATELVCFKLLGVDALKTVQRIGAESQKISALPLGTFIAYNRISNGKKAGRLF